MAAGTEVTQATGAQQDTTQPRKPPSRFWAKVRYQLLNVFAGLAFLYLLVPIAVVILFSFFFVGLIAEVGDGDPVAEHLVAAQPQFSGGIFRQRVTDFTELLDEVVDGDMVPHVDELLDASTHS